MDIVKAFAVAAEGFSLLVESKLQIGVHTGTVTPAILLNIRIL
jgi:hypothetical protein